MINARTMKGAITFIFILCLKSISAFSQEFEILNPINGGVIEGKMITSDLNADGFLDLLIVGKDDSGDPINRIFSITLNGELDSISTDLPGYNGHDLALSDLNNDGYNDLLISGFIDSIPSFGVFLNDHHFGFDQDENWPNITGNVRSGDLNNDGRMDLLLAGKDDQNENVSRIWLQDENQFIQKDSSGFKAMDEFELLDYDSDNYTDVLVSKVISDGIVSLELLKNNGEGDFNKVDQGFASYTHPVFGKGDLSQNGEMDLIVGGNRDGQDFIDIYYNQSGDFTLEESILIESKILDLIVVDITNDGLMDVITVTESSVVFLQNNIDSFDKFQLLDSLDGGSIAIGDFDRDDDQDLFVTGDRNGTLGTWIFKNNFLPNHRPGIPMLDSAYLTTDGFVVRWFPSVDDSTATQSLSYKVIVWNEDSLFNATNWTLSEYGPMELGNEYIFKRILPGVYRVNLVAIDNSLITSFSLPVDNVFGSMCGQGPGECILFAINPEIEVCKNEPIVIPSPNSEPVNWYSQKFDSLGSFSTLSYQTDVNDVLFTSYKDASDCKIYWYQSVVVKDTLDGDFGLIESLPRCKGDSVEMIELGISNIPELEKEWFISENGLNTVPLLFPFTIENDATIYLRLSSSSQNGCLWDSVEVIALPLPEIDAGPDVFVDLGESVKLNATGGISYYWSPSYGLSDSTIANPICRPIGDIEYTVTGIGENGCENQDWVRIIIIDESSPSNNVDPKLFVPNLFSPNNDGKNETFKILGDLNRVEKITIRIFSNSGSLLYESSDIDQIQSVGWDGTGKGNPMPAGTYRWSVVGRFNNGERISIEGRNSGLLTLVR